MFEKRRPTSDHYSNGRSQKHSRPDYYNQPPPPRHMPGGPRNDGPRNNNYPSPQSRNDGRDSKRNGESAYFEHIDRLPSPSKCEPCTLAKEEVDSGLIALLAKAEADEVTPDGDKDILRAAGELRRLLAARNNKKHAQRKQELEEARPSKGPYVMVPAYVGCKMEEAKELPPLPPILEPSLQEQVFTHKSVYEKHKPKIKGGDISMDDLTYERLEFTGDAYLELMATRLIAHRLPHLQVSAQAHFREQLVRNDTLGDFSRRYGLPDRLKHAAHITAKGKIWTKITADVFEAYVAAIVLSDPVDGFLTAEKWMNQLWAKQMLEYREPILIENAQAQDELHKLICMNHIELNYADEKDMEMTSTGQQRFYLGVYLKGWGYENEWLGSGVGQNKSQAASNAAHDALTRNSEVLQTAVKRKQEFMAQLQVERDERRKELRRRAEEGDAEAVADLRRVLTGDIRVKRKLAAKGDEDAAAKLKELEAEEAALAEKYDLPKAEDSKAQQKPAKTDESSGDGKAPDNAVKYGHAPSSKKDKKKSIDKPEALKATKETKQSADDFLSAILAGGKAGSKSANEPKKDGSSWLKREAEKKEKEERKRQKKEQEKKANTAWSHN